MPVSKIFFAVLLLFIVVNVSAQKKAVGPFEKVIVSPYIQVTFVEGDNESVTIDDIKVDQSKLHIDLSNRTLHIYLEGAKEIPKNEKEYKDGYTQTHALYENTTVIATVTYKKLNELSIRGEEDQLCKSAIAADKFTLRVYGESNIIFNELDVQQLQTTMYGESSLQIKSGSVRDQRYICYGEGKINTMDITGRTARITAYGEAEFKLNLSDRMKITAFGEAKVYYKGNPEIEKGLHFGDMSLVKVN